MSQCKKTFSWVWLRALHVTPKNVLGLRDRVHELHSGNGLLLKKSFRIVHVPAQLRSDLNIDLFMIFQEIHEPKYLEPELLEPVDFGIFWDFLTFTIQFLNEYSL